MIDITKDAKAFKAFTESPITLGHDGEITIHDYLNPYLAVCGLDYWTGVKNGKIGTDGRTSFFKYLVELRPSPSVVPDQLVMNTINLVKDACKQHPELKTFRWKAGTGDFTVSRDSEHVGAYYLPKGGHIHFGNLKRTDNLIYAFDCLLAPILLLLEDPLRAIMRRTHLYNFSGGTLYGQLGGWRASDKYPTWEYRTLPNFYKNWDLSVSIFAIAKAIGHEFEVNPKFSDEILKRVKSLRPSIIQFNYCLKDYFYPRISTIFKVLSKLELLNNDYGKSILNFMKSYIGSNSTWPIMSDMLEDFNIIPKKDLVKARLAKISNKVSSNPVIESANLSNMAGVYSQLTHRVNQQILTHMMVDLRNAKINKNPSQGKIRINCSHTSISDLVQGFMSESSRLVDSFQGLQPVNKEIISALTSSIQNFSGHTIII